MYKKDLLNTLYVPSIGLNAVDIVKTKSCAYPTLLTFHLWWTRLILNKTKKTNKKQQQHEEIWNNKLR